MTASPPPRQFDSGDVSRLCETSETRCFIVFIDGEPFGLPVDCVQTIFQIEAITPVPCGPPEVVGLVNLRGKIVTAVSLRRRLKMPDDSSAKSKLAIGMDHRGENFALLVDEVGDVIFLHARARITTPPHLDPNRAKLTDSVYRLESGILSMLDVGAVFDFQRRTA